MDAVSISDENNTIDGSQELAADGSPSGVEEDVVTQPYPFDVEKILISNKKISLSNVIRRLERGLIHAANLQRGENLWDIGRKSRLIESLMLKIPLPLFYAAATKNDELFIVDGLQRISTIKSFVAANGFRLQALEFLRELEGSTFERLPERMRIRIEETELDFAIIDPDSPPAVQRNIFKRLNTGGLPLTEQEIRHALYYGPVTEILKKLADSREFNDAVDHSVKDSRMAAQELILRFLSFSIFGVEEYRKDEEMDAFLSDTMQIINETMKKEYIDKNSDASHRNRKVITLNLGQIESNFYLAMERALELFNNCAFRITTPAAISTRKKKTRTPINKSLFEVWSVLLSNIPDKDFNKLKDNKDLLYQAIDKEFDNNNSSLRNFISKDSTKASGVRGRYESIHTIIDAVIREKTK